MTEFDIDSMNYLQGHLVPQSISPGQGEEGINAVGVMDTAPLCVALDPPDNRVQTSAAIVFKICVMVSANEQILKRLRLFIMKCIQIHFDIQINQSSFQMLCRSS